MIQVQSAFRAVAAVSLAVIGVLVRSAAAGADAREQAAGFEVLCDGRSLEGWRTEGQWTIEDGGLCTKDDNALIHYTGRVMPDDFELRFEWKATKGANGGVLYRPGQYEYQILDNPNSQHGASPRTSAAALFFCMGPSRDATRPFGEWNEGRIVCKGTVIQHWLNGEKVIDFDYRDPRWTTNLDLLRVRCFRPPYGGDLGARGGFLRLQGHGQQVWYRNLRMRAIPAGEELSRSPFEPMPIPPAGVKYERARIQRILEQMKEEVARAERVLAAMR